MRYSAVFASAFTIAATLASVSSHAATVTTLINPSTKKITLNNSTYIPSNYSLCGDLSAAQKSSGYYYCWINAGTLSSSQVSVINGLTYRDNPATKAISVSGVSYLPSDYSGCAKFTSAMLRNGYYWCRSSVGILPAETIAKLSVTSTPTSYTAQLNWTPPTTRESGAPLTMSELTGYEIYYTSDDLAQSVTVPVSGGSVTTLSVPNLKAGTYHFAISAIDSKGLKSALSPMVSKTLGQ